MIRTGLLLAGPVVAAALLAAGGCGGDGPDAGGASTPTSSPSPSRSPDDPSGSASAGSSAVPPSHRVLAVAGAVAGVTCPARVPAGTRCQRVRTGDGDMTQAVVYREAGVRELTVRSAALTTPPGSTQPAVTMVVAGTSTATLAALTRTAARDHGSLLLMTPRTVPLVAPAVQSPILDGRLQISGLGTRSRARWFVSLITSMSG